MHRRWIYDFLFTTRVPLIWELTLLVAIKLVGLLLIHHLFFSQPLGPELTPTAIAQHLMPS